MISLKEKLRREKISVSCKKSGVGKWMLGRKLPSWIRKKISEANKGKRRSEEIKRKMSETRRGKSIRHSGSFKKGHDVPKEWREAVRKAQWKGDEVGYFALHTWIRKQLGQPDTCEFCGKSGLSNKQIHWANKSREYKRELNDWLRLCAKCHKDYDLNKITI